LTSSQHPRKKMSDRDESDVGQIIIYDTETSVISEGDFPIVRYIKREGLCGKKRKLPFAKVPRLEAICVEIVSNTLFAQDIKEVLVVAEALKLSEFSDHVHRFYVKKYNTEQVSSALLQIAETCPQLMKSLFQFVAKIGLFYEEIKSDDSESEDSESDVSEKDDEEEGNDEEKELTEAEVKAYEERKKSHFNKLLKMWKLDEVKEIIDSLIETWPEFMVELFQFAAKEFVDGGVYRLFHRLRAQNKELEEDDDSDEFQDGLNYYHRVEDSHESDGDEDDSNLSDEDVDDSHGSDEDVEDSNESDEDEEDSHGSDGNEEDSHGRDGDVNDSHESASD